MRLNFLFYVIQFQWQSTTRISSGQHTNNARKQQYAIHSSVLLQFQHSLDSDRMPGNVAADGNWGYFGEGEGNEKPVHEACVSDFAIGKYEVTQGEWRKIMGNNPSSFSSCGDDCPVEQVTINYVAHLCRSSQSGVCIKVVSVIPCSRFTHGRTFLEGQITWN